MWLFSAWFFLAFQQDELFIQSYDGYGGVGESGADPVGGLIGGVTLRSSLDLSTGSNGGFAPPDDVVDSGDTEKSGTDVKEVYVLKSSLDALSNCSSGRFTPPDDIEEGDKAGKSIMELKKGNSLKSS